MEQKRQHNHTLTPPPTTTTTNNDDAHGVERQTLVGVERGEDEDTRRGERVRSKRPGKPKNAAVVYGTVVAQAERSYPGGSNKLHIFFWMRRLHTRDRGEREKEGGERGRKESSLTWQKT